MSQQKKAKPELIAKPYELPVRYNRHFNCLYVRKWISHNANFLTESNRDTIKEFCDTYDPLRTLFVTCEWLDLIDQASKAHRKGITYKIRYSSINFVDTKYEGNEAYHEKERAKKWLWLKLKRHYPNERFTVGYKNATYIVHMLDELVNPTIISHDGCPVEYKMVESGHLRL